MCIGKILPQQARYKAFKIPNENGKYTAAINLRPFSESGQRIVVWRHFLNLSQPEARSQCWKCQLPVLDVSKLGRHLHGVFGWWQYLFGEYPSIRRQWKYAIWFGCRAHSDRRASRCLWATTPSWDRTRERIDLSAKFSFQFTLRWKVSHNLVIITVAWTRTCYYYRCKCGKCSIEGIVKAEECQCCRELDCAKRK